jgi:hypothetical protein
MTMKRMLLASLVSGVTGLAASPVALAQMQLLNRGTMAAPDYGSGTSAGCCPIHSTRLNRMGVPA